MAPCKAKAVKLSISTSKGAIRITHTKVHMPPTPPPATAASVLVTDAVKIRKERNKISAAKSRANRKALFAQMQSTIEELRLENAALQAQVNDLLLKTTIPAHPEPYICALDSSRSWIADTAATMGGIREEDFELPDSDLALPDLHSPINFGDDDFT